MQRTIAYLLAVVLLAAPLAGCKSANSGSWIGAGTGAAAGALVGGIVGHQSGNKWEGAAIGAVIGGLAGYVAGTELGATSSDPQAKAAPDYDEANRLFDQANRTDDPRQAIGMYQQVIGMTPQYPEPYNNAGLRYLQLGERAQAKAYFEKALEVDPTYQPAVDNLARIASDSAGIHGG